jgi:hypothetical protein
MTFIGSAKTVPNAWTVTSMGVKAANVMNGLWMMMGPMIITAPHARLGAKGAVIKSGQSRSPIVMNATGTFVTCAKPKE